MFEEGIKALYPGKAGALWDHAWKVGFPDRHTESYRKASLQPVSKFTLATAGQVKIEGAIPAPIVLLTFEEAKKTYATFLENRIKSKLKEKNFFAALTNAIFEQGFFLYIPPNTVIDESISLSVLYEGENAYFAPHLQIFVGRGSSVRFQVSPLLKSGVSSQVIDIYMDRNASCHWVETTDFPYETMYMNAIRATVKENSHLQVWSHTKGSQFFRQDFQVELFENSEAVLKGASDLREKRVSHTEVLVAHRGPHARSNQHFKGVMQDSSRSTFEGKIFVEPEAQKTEAYQLNNNLLLGAESMVFSKPNLEIFADDVKASHGATVAQFSQEELFYFQTRGIGKEKAAQFLAAGFLKDVIYNV